MQFPKNNKQSDKDDNQPNTPPQPEWRRWLWPGLITLMILWVIFQSSSFFGGVTGQFTQIQYSEFRRQVNLGNVSEVVFEDENVRGVFNRAISINTGTRTVNVSQFATTLPPIEDVELISLLTEKNVTYNSRSSDVSPLLSLLINFAPLILIIAFFVWMARRAQGQMNGIFSFGRSQAREYDANLPTVTFADVAGQDAAKDELIEVVDFLKEPDKYIALGARVPRGVLLIGSPGTGKTLLARAVAGEANVPFFSISASEFVEMFVGVGASRVRDLFTRAKKEAPSIIFIDELDAVGRQRGAGLGGGNDEREQTLNQMLSEMDGFEQGTSIIVMAATNRADVLDPALMRPGRFDRQVTVDLPDRKGRYEILKVHTRDKPLGTDVDLEAMSKATVGFSGADIANLANEAALRAAKFSRKKITMPDFTNAFERIILGTERPPLSNKQERYVVAYHEAGHALVAALTPEADPVLKVTIMPRGQALGITAFLPEDDRRNYPRKYLEAHLKVALGGRVAEEVVMDDVTTGASNDLQRVTEMARRMVAQFGMSEEMGPVNFGEHESQPFLGYSISQGRNYSEETAAQIDVEVRKIIDHAYAETRKLIEANRDKLDALAKELLEHEILERNEVLDILGLTPEEAKQQPIVEPDPDLVLDTTEKLNMLQTHLQNEDHPSHNDDGEQSEE